MPSPKPHVVAKVLSGAPYGYNGALIEVETDIKVGLPTIHIVGLGNKAIDESRERVRSAITNSSLPFPAQKVVVNLAPAELPKDGTQLDIPIALSILIASGSLQQHHVQGSLFIGELALDGSVRPIRGGIIMAEAAKQEGLARIFLPAENAPQARLVEGVEVVPVSSLAQLYKGLIGAESFELEAAPHPLSSTKRGIKKGTGIDGPEASYPSLDTIYGLDSAKRALTIAAAGRHNILLSGSPGAGKTLLARTLAGLLPPLTPRETVEVTKLHSLSRGGTTAIRSRPPFRAPHHSATLTALIGGGLHPQPGDISLAHKGLLFLDELPEYPRSTLEALRQPLEDRRVALSRLYGRVTYPADFLLVATMNPCPCGYNGDSDTPCTCSPAIIDRYRHKISGPLLDRIDLRLEVSKIKNEHIFNAYSLPSSQHSKVLAEIIEARVLQKRRYRRSGFYNAYASARQVSQLFNATKGALALMHTASDKLHLTTRSYLRVLRVARTIADLDQSPSIQPQHVAEALRYR